VTQLDRRTKLVERWQVRWFPSCREFSAWVAARPDPNGRGGACADDHVARANRRAKGSIRRYCLHSKLDRLITLTYDAENLPGTRQEAFNDARAFVRRMRHDGHDLGAYIVVVERGTRGGRLHVHLGVGRFIPAAAIASGWQRGWVDVRRLLPRNVAGRRRAASELTAQYLAKYAAKSIEEDTERATGEHRYEVAQGYQPPTVEGWMTPEQLEEVCAAADWSMSWLDLDGQRPMCPWVVARGLKSRPNFMPDPRMLPPP